MLLGSYTLGQYEDFLGILGMKKIDFTVLIPVFNTKAAELIEAAFSVHPTNQSIKQDITLKKWYAFFLSGGD